MSNVKVVSHFSTNSETERRQTFNSLAKAMVILALRANEKDLKPETKK